MNEMILNTNALPETLLRLIKTEKVRICEKDGEIRLTPIVEQVDYVKVLRGSLSGYPEMSVDKFLERKRADREFDI